MPPATSTDFTGCSFRSLELLFFLDRARLDALVEIAGALARALDLPSDVRGHHRDVVGEAFQLPDLETF
jgi:hypothetical protein